MTPLEQLKAGLDTLGVQHTPVQVEKLLAYLDLLKRWNRHYNLVAEGTLSDAVARHLLDSLAAASYLEGEHIADVGSGAGLPGIPLAIVSPERAFTLIETSGKKCRFLSQAKVALSLNNVRVANQRVETLAPSPLFTAVTTRAFASVADSLALVEPILQPGGVLICLKGTRERTEQELQESQTNYAAHSVELAVPGLDEERRIVVLRKPNI